MAENSFRHIHSLYMQSRCCPEFRHCFHQVVPEAVTHKCDVKQTLQNDSQSPVSTSQTSFSAATRSSGRLVMRGKANGDEYLDSFREGLQSAMDSRTSSCCVYTRLSKEVPAFQHNPLRVSTLYPLKVEREKTSMMQLSAEACSSSGTISPDKVGTYVGT